jgi:hypothetical protein
MLSLAPKNGDLRLVERLLLFSTVNINYQDFRGIRPAIHGLISSEFFILYLLLSDKRIDVNITDRYSQALLQ